jgi:O-methyltransferase
MVDGSARSLISTKRGFTLRDLTGLRPAFLAAQRLVRRVGFEVKYVRVSGIKDANLYAPLFEPWNGPEWRARLYADDPRSVVPLDSKYVLHTHAAQAMRDTDGAVAECGVYRGGTAVILAEIARAHGRQTYLFDTFGGMPTTDSAKDLHREGDFADTSLSSVRAYVGERDDISYRPGFVPETFSGLEGTTFSFVHIDLDIFRSITDAIAFFYPRTAPGGIIVFDDYGQASCPGARAAVDEFFSGKPEVPFVAHTGQCIVRKSLR